MMKIQVFPDLSALHCAAAVLFKKIVCQSAERSRFSVCLSGGSTPKGLFRLLADDSEPYQKVINWRNIHFFWGDERCVPPDSSESNFRMAYQNLLFPMQISAMNYHRWKGELPPDEAKFEYEKILRLFFNLSDETIEPPKFDLILLGMGADGHTASIFPNSEVIKETTQIAAAPFVEKFGTHRLTLTPPVINNAANIVILVSGADKAETLQAVLEGEPNPQKYPVQIVRPTNGNLTWLIDEAAGKLLSPRLINNP